MRSIGGPGRGQAEQAQEFLHVRIHHDQHGVSMAQNKTSKRDVQSANGYGFADISCECMTFNASSWSPLVCCTCWDTFERTLDVRSGRDGEQRMTQVAVGCVNAPIVPRSTQDDPSKAQEYVRLGPPC